MLLAEAFFAGCWWLRFRWSLVAGAYAPLAAGGSASAGCWLLVPMLRWQLVASLPLATGGLTSAGMAAGGCPRFLSQ